MDYATQAKIVINTEIEGLASVRDAIDTGFSAAVDSILSCLRASRKIVVTGVGKNLHIAEKISATLASTGSTSVVLNPTQAIHGDLGILLDGDVLLALSYSGESEELISLVPLVKRMNVTIISLIGKGDSTLGRFSDIVIPVGVPREACPFNMAPTASTTATLAVGDALAMVLLEAQGFQKEDYAKLHPGGAIGRALLIQVSDIMRTGNRLAIVGPDAKVKDSVVAMTQARAGFTGVVDNDNRLLGIFTDGDLRRHLMDKPDILEQPVSAVMTRSPVCLEANHLAVDVLRVFEAHNIDDLPVVDEKGRLIGAVDIQDLPKLKIM
jgi:arabinose-5-phosphate isomerase